MIRQGSQRSELFQNVFTRGNTSCTTRKSQTPPTISFSLGKSTQVQRKSNNLIFYNINILILCNLYLPRKLKLKGLQNCTVWNKFECLRENQTIATLRSKS